MIAISEKSEKGPVITLWDPVIFRKRKTLTIPADKQCQATEFAHFQFSYDSKYIVAITGEPDWTLYNIKCEKGRLESSARAINLNGTGTIEEVYMLYTVSEIRDFIQEIEGRLNGKCFREFNADFKYVFNNSSLCNKKINK